MSDPAQSGWRKAYRRLWEHPTRPFLPWEVAELTVPQLILVLGPDPDDETAAYWRE